MAISKSGRIKGKVTAVGQDAVLNNHAMSQIKEAMAFKPTKTARMHGEIDRDGEGNVDLISEIKKHPEALWIRVKAIEADRENDNGDYFSREEILKSYKSFEGCPVFTNHENQKVENAKGKVVLAEWSEEDGSVYCTMFIDREANPALCRAIEEGYVTDVSMGTQVDYSICSVCANKAYTADQYCNHVKTLKGRNVEGHKVYEENYGLKFIEISVVTDGACKDCTIREIIDPSERLNSSQQLLQVANNIRSIKTSLYKNSGQEEIKLLNTAMDNIEKVLRAMLDQRQYIDLEFMSNLADVFAQLQQATDELVDQGYGNLGSPSQQAGGVPPMPETGKEQGPTEPNGINTGPTQTGVGTVTGPAATASSGVEGLRLSGQQSNIRNRLKDLAEKSQKIYEEISTGDNHVSKAEKFQNTISKLAQIWENPSVKNFTTEVSEGEFKIVVGKEEILGLQGGKKVASLRVDSLDEDIRSALREDRDSTAAAILDAFKSRCASLGKEAGERGKGPSSEAPVDSKAQWEQTMEAQLREQNLPLHPRENVVREEITEKQFSKTYSGYDHHKQGLEGGPRQQITEKQLQPGLSDGYEMYEYHKVQEDPRDEITELQLKNDKWQGNVTGNFGPDHEWASGVSDQKQQITEGQLEDWKGSDSRYLPTDKITEKQLRDDQGDPLGRRAASQRLEKIASEEDAKAALEGAMNAIKRTAKATGATPAEIIMAVEDFSGNAERAAKTAMTLDNDKARETRVATLKRSMFYGASRKPDMNEVCTYLLGSLSDQKLGATAGLEALEAIATQEDAENMLADAIKKAEYAEVKEQKKASSKQLLKSVLTAAPAKSEPAPEDVDVVMSRSDVGVDQSKEGFAEAAFAAARKIASSQGVEVVENVDIDLSDSKNLTVHMRGRKSASTTQKVAKEAGCSCGHGDGPCDCGPDCKCGCNKDKKAAAEKETKAASLEDRAKARKQVVEAQFGGGGGGMQPPGPPAGGPGGSGGTTMPATPPGDPSMDPGLGALAEPPADEMSGPDDVDGEAVPPGSICPSCGSDNVDFKGGELNCNNCGAHGTIEVTFKMDNMPGATAEEKGPGMNGDEEAAPEGIGEMEGGEGMEMPEVGIAASYRISPEMVKKAGNKPVGSFCPHCGSNDIKLNKHAGACNKCSGKYRVDTYVDTENNELIGRIAWYDRNVSKLARKQASQSKRRMISAKKNGQEMGSRLDALTTALKAKGWTESFAKASMEQQADMIANLAQEGLIPKK